MKTILTKVKNKSPKDQQSNFMQSKNKDKASKGNKHKGKLISKIYAKDEARIIEG